MTLAEKYSQPNATPSTQQKQRQSNIELLRIIAMTMIVSGHIILHGLNNEPQYSKNIISLTIYGVNIFVLISGYFRIKLKFRSLIDLIGCVYFYVILSYIATYGIYGEPLQFSHLKHILFPISCYDYWFVSVYIFLMLISPLINSGMERMSDRMQVIVLSALFYISCFSGWVLVSPINPSGYNIIQFIFMYMLGGIIRRYDAILKRIPTKWYILTFIAIYIVVLFISKISDSKAFPYNSPLVISGAIILFCLFAKTRIKNSRWINYIAGCMFPVYLIQDGHIGQYLYKTIYDSYINTNGGGNFFFYAILLGYFTFLFISAISLESLRRLLMSSLVGRLSIFFEKTIETITHKISHKLNSWNQPKWL